MSVISRSSGLNCSQQMFYWPLSEWLIPFFFYWAVQLLHGKSPMGFGLFKDATDQWLELFTENLCALFQGGWSFCYWQEKPKEFGVYKRCHWPVVLVVDRIFLCLVPGQLSAIFYLWPVVWGADGTFLCFVPGQLISCPLPWPSGLRCWQNISVVCSRAATQLSSTLKALRGCGAWSGSSTSTQSRRGIPASI